MSVGAARSSGIRRLIPIATGSPGGSRRSLRKGKASPRSLSMAVDPTLPPPHLEPCPWCGQPLQMTWRRHNPRASCRTEGCFGYMRVAFALDMPEQIEAWNRRASLAAPAAVPAEPKGVAQFAPQQAAPTESVLIDGIAYDTPAPVAAELLRLHIDAQLAVPVAQWDGVDEALRCAEWLEHIAAGGEVVEIDGLARASAAELRRLHAQAGEHRGGQQHG